MSMQAQVNVEQLLEEISKVLCKECRKKVGELRIPVQATARVEDLIKKRE